VRLFTARSLHRGCITTHPGRVCTSDPHPWR
jgi:hypothetical protein